MMKILEVEREQMRAKLDEMAESNLEMRTSIGKLEQIRKL